MNMREVYLNEFNVLMPGTAYLPLVSGLLRGYAESIEKIRQHYQFMPFFFLRDNPENILSRYKFPVVAAFSVSMWNEQFSLRLAELVKRSFPECLIVFGGPQVPHDSKEYFTQYPFIDISVRGEGEIAFAHILERLTESRNFGSIPGISWREHITGRYLMNPEAPQMLMDLDSYPSPYILGYYENLFTENPQLTFQAIIETDRGCPYQCSYCYWGHGGLSRRFRRHSLERIRQEIEWIAKHHIVYLFNAASNFGVHECDIHIANMLVNAKQQFKYPEKFRTCYDKNAEDRIYAIGSLLHKHQMEKGITLSHQSMSQVALHNVRRRNISTKMYQSIQAKFNRIAVPVYTELILGLPGETYESWKLGLDLLLESGLKNQLFIYHCQVYPNTEIADQAYQRKFGIVTRRLMLTETHAAVHNLNAIREYEDIIISTTSLPLEDWKKATILSWFTMVLISLKLAFYIFLYLRQRLGIPFMDFMSYLTELRMPVGLGNIIRKEIGAYNGHIEEMLTGVSGHGSMLPEYGAIYWDVEEVSFLRLLERKSDFYNEMRGLVLQFCSDKGIACPSQEFDEVIQYQRMRTPSASLEFQKAFTFHFNLQDYFQAAVEAHPIPLTEEVQTLSVYPRDFQGDKIRFAREILLWGRKSDTIMEQITILA